MNKLFSFFSLFLISMSIGCNKPLAERVYSFQVKDESGKGFGLLISELYPDTTIPDQYSKIKGIPPLQSVPVDSKIKWEKYFAGLPADTLSLFLFSGDTLQKYSWAEVRAGYKIIKRIDLSLDYLKAKNYTITYP
ncbi:MAG: hypothetical protein IT249_18850 [Chitinophagaceae bacterium]|nr:hypothetical protein [Chitinophagaceae bacterium]